MLLVIELADAGLIALPEEGEIAAPSPGLAIIDGVSVIVGRAAAERARLTPRRLHNRFWIDISTEEMGRPRGSRLRTADLAWTQLSELWSEVGRGVTRVILAVPGGLDSRLGLIFGVARAAGLPVTGLVDAAVAAAVDRTAETPVLHLDLELHRAVLTVLEPGPRRGMVSTTERVGLVGLSDVWMRLVADLFLKTTRFDPFHSAASEQDLYNHLGSILGELRRRSSTTVSLTTDGLSFSAELARERAISAADTGYAEIDRIVTAATTHDPSTLLLSARAAAAPGLAERLAETTGLEIVELPSAAAAAGAHRLPHRIEAAGPALPLVTDLGAEEAP